MKKQSSLQRFIALAAPVLLLPLAFDVYYMSAKTSVASNYTPSMLATALPAEMDAPPALLANGSVDDSNRLVILPGELPGYTGWPRPSQTLAGYFRMVHHCNKATEIDAQWKCLMHCHHQACKRGGSLFYVRAYGPAVLSGQVEDHRNGTYTVTFRPLDTGRYTVEAVLTFSNPPPLRTFPMSNLTEPTYEGYLLPSFPMTVTARASASAASSVLERNLPPCTTADLLESSLDSALSTGRWRVQEKVLENPFVARPFIADNHGLTRQGYEHGLNSLGMRMDYVHRKCTLLSEADVRGSNRLAECKQRNPAFQKHIHLVLVGDSNIGMQADWADKQDTLGHQYKGSIVMTHGGLLAQLNNITAELEKVLHEDAQAGIAAHYIVVFNSGMHDIIHLCASEDYGILLNFTARGTARCGDLYRRKLTEFALLIQDFPSAFTVFQNTHAAWPKWGCAGAAWPSARKQGMPYSASFSSYFNNIAFQVMGKLKIPTMDTYWLTHSRPDHREVTGGNHIPEKMAHAGPEVYSVLIRKLTTMILETICGPSQ